MKYLGLLFLLLPSIALAQSSESSTGSPTSAAAPPSSSATPPSAEYNNPTMPARTELPHCNRYSTASAVPMELLRKGTETILKFTIKEDGTVENIVISQSSGNDVLDKAATDCAATWHYKPATKDGQPVEISWTAKVHWQIK